MWMVLQMSLNQIVSNGECSNAPRFVLTMKSEYHLRALKTYP